MIIEKDIEFNQEEPLLSKQSEEFKKWFSDNIQLHITDQLKPDSFDKYERPVSFTIEYGGFLIVVKWIYIYECIESWACSDYELNIREVGNAR